MWVLVCGFVCFVLFLRTAKRKAKMVRLATWGQAELGPLVPSVRRKYQQKGVWAGRTKLECIPGLGRKDVGSGAFRGRC